MNAYIYFNTIYLDKVFGKVSIGDSINVDKAPTLFKICILKSLLSDWFVSVSLSVCVKFDKPKSNDKNKYHLKLINHVTKNIMDTFLKSSTFRILIVDDIPLNIRIVSNMLEDEGYELMHAVNGKSAISLARSNAFDLILLDVRMPDINGFDVCRTLRKEHGTKDVPVIFLTSEDDTESIVEGFKVGATDYVTKPFNGPELIARVKTHLELSRSKRELISMNEQLRKSEETFRYLAIHDNLTNLYNTRYLYQSLADIISDSSRNNDHFSLIFMDIDNFKCVVDTYGHLNGSRALQEVAHTIMESLQDPSYGVAYGGDEFVIVLPEFNKSQAINKAEEIRNRMNQTVYLVNQGHHVKLCASFGISTYPEDSSDMTGLLSKADQAMFDVKEQGKNAILSCTSDLA